MIKIREMEIDDIDEMVKLEESIFSEPWTRNGFFSFYMREDVRILIACEDEEILGYCGVMMVLDEGDITNMAVSPDRRREGIGRRLMSAMIYETGDHGVDKLHLEVRESNSGAIALYESLGFCRDGLRRGYYQSPTEDALLMTRG